MPYPGGTKSVNGPVGVGGPTGSGTVGAGGTRRKYVPLSLFFLQMGDQGEDDDQLYGKKKKSKKRGGGNKDGQQDKNKRDGKAVDQTAAGKGDDTVATDTGGSRSGPGVKAPLGTVSAGGGRQEWLEVDPWGIGPVVEQAIDSADTSVNTVPALFKKVKWKKGSTNVDIGGGKYDTGSKHLAKKGVKNVVYDPYNRSDKENASAMKLIRGGACGTATIANVLNVIRSPGARAKVCRLASKAIGAAGIAYFGVYTGDNSGKGQQTSKGWQENRALSTYADEVKRHFKNVEVKGGAIVADNKAGKDLKEERAERSGAVAVSMEEHVHSLPGGDVTGAAGPGPKHTHSMPRGGQTGKPVYSKGSHTHSTGDGKTGPSKHLKAESLDQLGDRLLAEGSIRQEGGQWCVVNEPTNLVIKAGGKRRCYDSKSEATRVWHELDCKYTGRHCEELSERKISQPQTCKTKGCESPATKGVIWADGRAYVPTCDKHLASWKKKLADVTSVRDIPQRQSTAATEAVERLKATPAEIKAIGIRWKKLPAPKGKPFETVGYETQTSMGKATITKKGKTWILKIGKETFDLGRKASFDHAEGALLKLYRKSEGAGFATSMSTQGGLGAARLSSGTMGTGNVATVPVPIGEPIRRLMPSGRRKKKKKRKEREEWSERLARLAL